MHGSVFKVYDNLDFSYIYQENLKNLLYFLQYLRSEVQKAIPLKTHRFGNVYNPCSL